MTQVASGTRVKELDRRPGNDDAFAESAASCDEHLGSVRRRDATAYGEDVWVKGEPLARDTCGAVKTSRGPANTKISCEGRHRECSDLVSCILLFCGQVTPST